jgi:hypothetical protein
MKVGDLVQRKGTSEWKAIVTGFIGDHGVRIIWFDCLSGGRTDACSKELLEVLT